MEKQKIVGLGGIIGAAIGYTIQIEGKEAYEYALKGLLFGGITTAAYFAYESLSGKNNRSPNQSVREKSLERKVE